jgi:hypothetical protein
MGFSVIATYLPVIGSIQSQNKKFSFHRLQFCIPIATKKLFGTKREREKVGGDMKMHNEVHSSYSSLIQLG